jgi:threonine synthase
MWGFQAEGAAPIVRGELVPRPDTVATAIRVGNPASWDLAEAARDESGGRIEAVTDQQILSAQRELAAREGVFVEPASAAGVAGLLATKAAGRLDGGLTVVVTVTGNGLKDIDTALAFAAPAGVEAPVTPADTDAVARVTGLV